MIGKNPKSLKDTLLECGVYNFPKVFSVFFGDPLIARQFKLPVGLFDELLEKSLELRYRINPKYLEELMPFRDVLRLTNIDISLEQISIYSKIGGFLDKLNTVEYPLLSLSVWYLELTENDMLNIQAVSSTLECLELAYHSRPVTEILNASFPNLKRLSLRVDGSHDDIKGPLNINLQLFSSLEELVINHEQVDESFIKQLPFLKNLKVLSLPYTWIHFQNDHIYEALGSLSNLRSLDLRHHDIYKSDYVMKFSNVLSKLTKLTNLDISFSNLCQKQQYLMLKKLKKIGLCYESDTFSDNNNFVDQGSDLLSYYEMYCKKGQSSYMLDDLMNEFIPRDKMNLQRVEKVILDSHEYFGIFFKEICNYITDKNSSDFIMKLINQYINCYDRKSCFEELEVYFLAGRFDSECFDNVVVIRCLLDFIRKNVNKRFVKKLVQILFIIMFYKSNTNTNVGWELQVYMICTRSLESDIFDEEDKIHFMAFHKDLYTRCKK